MCLIFIGLLFVVAVFANFLVDESLVTTQNVAERIQGPSSAHWFGIIWIMKTLHNHNRVDKLMSEGKYENN